MAVFWNIKLCEEGNLDHDQKISSLLNAHF